MVGIRHIFDFQFGIIRYFICKRKELVLICIQNSIQLNVLPQDIMGRSVHRKFCDFKAEHLA